jgi:hypothetical protein
VAVQVLQSLDPDLPRVRQQVINLLSGYAPGKEESRRLEGAVENLFRTRRTGGLQWLRSRLSRPSAPIVIVVVFYIVATLVARRRGYNMGGNIVVRCREGHLFTTIWIPGVSFKAVRLGWARLQRCPVGKHWTLVTPVRNSDLTDEERRVASEHRDVRIP